MCYSAGAAYAGARMLVYQHGRDNQGFLHGEGDGGGGAVTRA